FQAEDGIRDRTVTGVQTCALPIFITRSPALLLCMGVGALQMMINYGIMGFTPSFLMKHYGLSTATTGLEFGVLAGALGIMGPLRSEERRVGKEGRWWGAAGA